jgi:hypothetical protein
MRTGRIITIIALAVLGTVAVAQKTTYDYDRAADFAKFKTYAWVPATEPPKDELNHRRIVAAIEADGGKGADQGSGLRRTRRSDDVSH